ncbi:alpha/beta fold hydrolase [Sphingorhabdus sp. EL138]|uniref:alpha/beta fold hydrolase n=1 Tax=Sphingorhabdus sp. EL138 TaxID=2073156 RepID=UPI000D687601|nr:alpha/beta hydrolase [Sphingorhabdus sp. EL138]
MPFLETHNAKIYYETHGHGDPPIILAHGVGGNSLAWWQQVPFLAQTHRVIIFDHRGFGRSEDPDMLGRSEFVNDLAALIDDLNLKNPILIGQSMGGIACSGYLAKNPNNVSALVMADTLLGLDIPEDIKFALQEERSRCEHLAQNERAMDKYTRTNKPALSYLFSHISAFNGVNRRSLQGNFEPVSLPRLVAAEVPIMFIVGQGDFLFAPRFVKAVQAAMPNADYTEIPNTGHSPYFEDADSFNKTIDKFITEHDLART